MFNIGAALDIDQNTDCELLLNCNCSPNFDHGGQEKGQDAI